MQMMPLELRAHQCAEAETIDKDVTKRDAAMDKSDW